MNIYDKKPNWSLDEIIKEIDYFSKIYPDRPIKNNNGGMMFSHMFAFYFLLKKINPEFVIESGVFKGQGTWLIEKTLPDAKILSLDIKLNYREYISKKAEYSNIDFKYHDFANINPDKTLVIFDDHQNALERLKDSKWFNIKHIIFDDNYPPNKGDFYSLKKAFKGSGFKINQNILFERLKGIIIFLSYQVKSLFLKNYPYPDNHRFRSNSVIPNLNDLKYLNKNIDLYYEFPPIFMPKKYINEPIENELFKDTKSLLSDDHKDKYHDAFNEKDNYNWITYIKLS